MKNQVILKKGQKVKVSDNNNASEFNIGESWSIIGVYKISGWETKEFEIEGTVKLITFTHNPKVYGAYLLKYNGVNVGYVYNIGIKAIE